jgi:ATP-dependent DNA ligase
MQLPVMPPVKPMLAKAVHELPPAGPVTLHFEPKWDGFRCVVFRDGDDVELGSRNDRPFNRYFPELVDPLRACLPERCVVDGELVVVSATGLDFDMLGQRIHPAQSRVRMLAGKWPASFIAFDLLAVGDEDLTATPFAERRRRLEALAARFRPPVHLTPSTTDRAVAADWYERFEGAGFDGLMAKAADGLYVQDKRVQLKVKRQRSADCVVAGYRIHKSGDGVGSLVLGLYDDAANLHHVGVAASFKAADRPRLLAQLQELHLDDIAEHPWAGWLSAEAHLSADGRMPGAPNRWSQSNDRDLSWVPLQLALVAEVQFEHATGGRFRGTTRLLRWRPDRTPRSCHVDQLASKPPLELELLRGTA